MTFKEYLMECDGLRVVQTNHSFDRALERGWDESNLKMFIADIGYYISTNRDQIQAFGYNEEIFYWDGYFNCGAIATVRRNYKNKREFIIAIITVYPVGSPRPLHPGTRKISIDKRYSGKTYDKWGFIES